MAKRQRDEAKSTAASVGILTPIWSKVLDYQAKVAAKTGVTIREKEIVNQATELGLADLGKKLGK